MGCTLIPSFISCPTSLPQAGVLSDFFLFTFFMYFQAMVAESTEKHEDDAMDLYRHSTQLSCHPEGALGYANLVLSKVLNAPDKTNRNYVFCIENMNAIVTASDALTWCTGKLSFSSQHSILTRDLGGPCVKNKYPLFCITYVIYV